MNKHTPSPWIHRTRLDNGANISCKNGYAICDIAYSYSSLPKEELDANAALISAAPDLLAALEAMTYYFAEYEKDDSAKYGFKAARAAIAKATAQ
jgi:hypothetical protein